MQYCGTVIIYCGFVLTLQKLRFRFRIQTIFSSFSTTTNFFYKILPFSLLEAALLPTKLASHFWYFYFFIPFYVGSGSKYGSGTCMHSCSGSGSATVRQKVPVSVPQHWSARACRRRRPRWCSSGSLSRRGSRAGRDWPPSGPAWSGTAAPAGRTAHRPRCII